MHCSFSISFPWVWTHVIDVNLEQIWWNWLNVISWFRLWRQLNFFEKEDSPNMFKSSFVVNQNKQSISCLLNNFANSWLGLHQVRKNAQVAKPTPNWLGFQASSQLYLVNWYVQFAPYSSCYAHAWFAMGCQVGKNAYCLDRGPLFSLMIIIFSYIGIIYTVNPIMFCDVGIIVCHCSTIFYLIFKIHSVCARYFFSLWLLF